MTSYLEQNEIINILVSKEKGHVFTVTTHVGMKRGTVCMALFELEGKHGLHLLVRNVSEMVE
jgi:hypothetical protein